MRMAKCTATTLTAFAFSSIASATLTVTGNNGLAIASAYYTITALGGNHYNVSLNTNYNAFGGTYFEIHGTGGEDLDNVYMNAVSAGGGDPIYLKVLSDNASGIHTVGLITENAAGLHFLSTVNIKGSLGPTDMDIMGDITVVGDVVGDIVADTDGSDNSSAGLTVLTVGGSLLADVLVPQGRVVAINVTGDIGTKPVHRIPPTPGDEISSPDQGEPWFTVR